MENGRCRMHGGKLRGGPVGNAHARKHGHYGADAIALRRRLKELIEDITDTVEQLS